MATELTLQLATRAYAAFLVAFRNVDTTEVRDHDVTVAYQDESGATHRYFYKVPNFRLVGYSVRGGARVNLTGYNYGDGELKEAAATRADFEGALQSGGGGGTTMTPSLARVIALTSEAARSRVVEKQMIAMLGGGTVDLTRLRRLFNDYGHVAVFCRYRLGEDSYSPTWRAIDKSDYQRFYTRMEYTGDRAASLANVTTL
ncbi:hypothetical protein SAMN02800694_2179 [Luteibacter sp. UNCMF331Sha3.1]|uniref:ribosome-inactivating family protein n=1 Tax=Luteibacter sp. UNCMF331Sha3.1 TaxID=1502760 RepID=UPI0008C2D75F|nr:ribosome-inactivating family protein [Luteibacter sp. UNCMF331Sha3.1]SEM93042.1 hypothetical protein SAMN02800694_2179 [Luteibacter sp. UNCMF331Sha3.1]